MSHSVTLKLLTPLALGNVFSLDIIIEGSHLDQTAARGHVLSKELFSDETYEVLEHWERVYGAVPNFYDSVLIRQNRIVHKMRELGRLDREYFIQLAASLGYVVVLEELHPFMPDWSGAGEELGDDASDWCWRLYYTESDEAYVFRAGSSFTGENLSYSYADIMKQIIIDLKPADTFVDFIES